VCLLPSCIDPLFPQNSEFSVSSLCTLWLKRGRISKIVHLITQRNAELGAMKNMIAILALALSLLALRGQAQYYTDATPQLPVAATVPLTMDVEFFDVDNDNDLDLILACEFQQNLLLFNDGFGNFSQDVQRLFPPRTTYIPNTFNQGEDSEDIALEDFNGDGKMDILFVSEDSPYHELLFGADSGTFYLAPSQIPRTNKANAVLTMDFNGDTHIDVLLGHTGENYLYLNNGDGSFYKDSLGLFPTNLNQTQDLKAADLDLDGDMDIVEGCEFGGSNIYINNNGLFTEESNRFNTNVEEYETRKIAVEDVNGDQFPDLFLCNVSWRNTVISQSLLMINDGTGSFTDQTTLRFPYAHAFTLDALFMDLNGDGVKDMVTCGDGDIFNPKAYLNNPDSLGYFSHAPEMFPDLYQGRMIAIAAADVNGDDQLDLYLGSTPDRMLLWQEPTGIASIQDGSGMSTFYNAQQGLLHVRGLKNTDRQLQVYDALGRSLGEFNLQVVNGEEQVQVSDRMKSQVIFIRIEDAGGNVRTAQPLLLH